MLTQTITLDLLNNIPEEAAVVRAGETGRKIRFVAINSATEDPVDLSSFDIDYNLYKPDGNFITDTVYADSDGSVTIQFTEQMTASEGYGRIDLKLTDSDGILYTCHAVILFDTPIAGTELVDSVSMVYGLVFPDDFQQKLTAGANITITEDNVISSTGGGGGGTGDYADLINKPRINNVILSGNKTTAQLGLPTKTSDITNDSGFITAAVNNLTNYYKKTDTYTKTEVNDLLASVSSLNLEVVAVLPDHDISTTTIYLVPKDVPGTDDVYDEYIYISNSWEKIGSTSADLSNYYTKAQTDTLIASKVDKEAGKGLSTNDFTTAEKNKLAGIEAGAEVNVQADWNQTKVDADDYIKNKPSIGVYTAGNGIDITNNRISVTDLVLDQITKTATNLGQPPAYDSTASYIVGDVCEHDGYCYKCNTPITGGETWDSDHWDATDAWDQVDTLNQNLAEIGTIENAGGASTSVSANTWTTLASITLGKGIWIISSQINLATSVTSVYAHRMVYDGESQVIRQNGQSGGGSNMTQILSLSGNTAFNLTMYISTALNATGSITAIKINN